MVVVDRCGRQRKVSLAAINVILSGVQNGSNPLPVATGTGFSGVQKSVPVPVPQSYL